MSQVSFEQIQSVSILSNDGLPACASICLVPTLIENSLCVAVGGFDGVARLVQFSDTKSGHQFISDASHDSKTNACVIYDPIPPNYMDADVADSSPNSGSELDVNQQIDIISIGRDNYPILSVASVSRNPFVVLAYGGLGRHIQLEIRSLASFPSFMPLLTIDIPAPISCLSLHTQSYNKQKEITWNLRLFAGCQDKSIHMYSVSVIISLDASNFKASVFHHVKFVGHNSFVRSVSMSQVSKEVLLSGSDDFNLKVWPLDMLRDDKSTKCTTYEAHEDDILTIDCKAGWVITGSKDKSVGFLNLNPAKNARAEKSREDTLVKIPVGSVVRSVLLSDDAHSAFAGCGDGSIKTFSRNTETGVWTVTGEQKLLNAPIDSLLFEQGVLVTCSQDPCRTIAVWSIPQGS